VADSQRPQPHLPVEGVGLVSEPRRYLKNMLLT
jgi:hypothetical protein